MFDLEEFVVAISEMGIDISIYPSQGEVVVEMNMVKGDVPIGTVKAKTAEKGIARLIHKLASSKLTLNQLVGEDRLSVL